MQVIVEYKSTGSRFSHQRLWAAVAISLFVSVPLFSQSANPALITPEAAARFLDQATWGPTPASVAQLQQAGFEAWFEAQFSDNSSDLPDQAVNTESSNDLTPVQQAFFQNALYGTDQLRQRIAFILSEIWVVSAVQVEPAYAYAPYWRIFRDNAFGNYRDIIRNVTLNPAMGSYLNMANNNKANAAKGTAANENYARELMQLFTLGLTQLNPDGSAVLDTSGNPVPTYNQAIVTNLAKALTGWTYPTAPGATPSTSGNNTEYLVGQMFAVEKNHDTSAKAIFSGLTIPAGQTAEQDLDTLIEDLMNQPTMAPFVCKQLIQHLVTSNPSPAYIQQCSTVFSNDGNGVQGNMKAVIQAILMDTEARAKDPVGSIIDPSFGHLREPVLFMANILRGLNATLGSQSTIYSNTNKLGQNLFYPPTVFSYFSPLYRTENGLLGPEFQIYSTQTAANRADIVNSALFGKLDGSTTFDLTPFIQAGDNMDALMNLANSTFLHGSMSDELNSAAWSAANAATTAKARAQQVLYIVLTSGEYQIVH